MDWLNFVLRLIGIPVTVKPKAKPPVKPHAKPPDKPKPVDPALNPSTIEGRIGLINQARASVGSPPLAYHNGCQEAAQVQSNFQAIRDMIGHDGPAWAPHVSNRLDNFGVLYRDCNEIAASGYPPTAGLTYTFIDSIDSWMNDSPGHRAILLDPHWTHCGAAMAFAQNRRPYSTVVFIQA